MWLRRVPVHIVRAVKEASEEGGLRLSGGTRRKRLDRVSGGSWEFKDKARRASRAQRESVLGMIRRVGGSGVWRLHFECVGEFVACM